MRKPKISIIVALDEKNGIGKRNGMMWHIPEELKRFKAITMGHPIIMGRKTYESIGKPLPGRTSIVITRDENFSKGHAELVEPHKIVYSLKEALNYAKKLDQQEIFIIGGGQIYQQAMDLADKLYFTLIQGDFQADVFFPDYSQFNKKISESKWQQSNGHKYKYKFLQFER